jgi:hypothetical protein
MPAEDGGMVGGAVHGAGGEEQLKVGHGIAGGADLLEEVVEGGAGEELGGGFGSGFAGALDEQAVALVVEAGQVDDDAVGAGVTVGGRGVFDVERLLVGAGLAIAHEVVAGGGVVVDFKVGGGGVECDPGVGAQAADEDGVAVFEFLEAEVAGGADAGMGAGGFRNTLEARDEVEVGDAGVLAAGEHGPEHGGFGRFVIEVGLVDVGGQVNGFAGELFHEDEGAVGGDDEDGAVGVGVRWVGVVGAEDGRPEGMHRGRLVRGLGACRAQDHVEQGDEQKHRGEEKQRGEWVGESGDGGWRGVGNGWRRQRESGRLGDGQRGCGATLDRGDVGAFGDVEKERLRAARGGEVFVEPLAQEACLGADDAVFADVVAGGAAEDRGADALLIDGGGVAVAVLVKDELEKGSEPVGFAEQVGGEDARDQLLLFLERRRCVFRLLHGLVRCVWMVAEHSP